MTFVSQKEVKIYIAAMEIQVIVFTLLFSFSMESSIGHLSPGLQCLYCEHDACNNRTGICGKCLPGFHGERCEHTCPNTCNTCEQTTGTCTSCLVGWYGQHCQFQCFHCYQCEMDTGICQLCPAGTWGENCEHTCSTGCEHCDIDSGECQHCARGYYGTNCTEACGFCLQQKCDRVSGECENGCRKGWFGQYCKKACAANCLECNANDGTCRTCQPTFWGPECTKICPLNCDYCNVTTGECLECVYGYYGKTCSETCGQCIDQWCERETGHCEYECKDGWYGKKCDHQCSGNCTRCISDDECHVCAKGLAGDKCNIVCPESCSSCAQDVILGDVTCTECKGEYTVAQKNCSCTDEKCVRFGQGWTGRICEECQANSGWFLHSGTCCPCKHCQGGIKNCDGNGNCREGCEPKYFPPNQGCDTYCDIENCRWCEPLFGYGKICVGCEPGYYLGVDICEPCSTHCKGGPLHCHNKTGICSRGCEPGWFGPMCDTQCHDRNCDICSDDQVKCLKCRDGFWGQSCMTPCPDNCLTCSKENGKCTQCLNGYFSSDCKLSCDNCLNKKCDDKGKCQLGCRDGMFGQNCDKVCSKGCARCKNSEKCENCYSNTTMKDGVCVGTCENCQDEKCDKEKNCLNGCVEGFSGVKCDRPQEPESVKCSDKSACSKAFTINKYCGILLKLLYATYFIFIFNYM